MDLSAYTLEPLHEDGGRILYRGAHRGPRGAAPPSVLVAAPSGEYAAPATLARLQHEYSLAAELDPRWAVRPVALVRHQGRTLLVLDDPGGEPLDRLLGKPMETGAFLRLAIGLARAVAGVHAAGLIHKDIKPAHVLVNRASGDLRLTGFGIASRLRRERQVPASPEFIAGTLPYMAPEQTGRMNRSIDSRSDLYALGVTLYELLTGSLPFTASDPMEWVHCHVARRPMPPAKRTRETPVTLSAIVMKLLAKTAEERYQTAAGLESDLRRCLAAWDARRRIDDFPLGEHDMPDRLLIPEKLYGREREIQALLAAFDRVVKRGVPELVLVSGYSGIGKSSVVNELHKMLVPPRGVFASGKFDQYKRDIPYSTLAQAFQSLIRPLLAKSEADLAPWREALREALGPNARLMVDLVPELALLIGDPPPVPDLPPQQAQGRFQRVFRRFIGVFARPDHPMALFLDDLQWLDAATLDLLEDLLTNPEVRHLLLIGAYRDNEVSAVHPLARKLDAIRQAGAIVPQLSLAPLGRDDVGELMADALRCEPGHAAPLAQLVYEKTAGNPFFAIQFISALAEEGLLTFDHGNGRWSWEPDRIHAKGYTDNVADLMVGKLKRLPAETREGLQQLACVGNTAQITSLCLVYGTSEQAVHERLWEAVRQELIERLESSYRFVHDRVHEATYSLIPTALRAESHVRIGRLLAAHTSPEKREEAIFEIVSQLNRGVDLITSRDERERLAELDLIAGRRAKASTAYAAALNYLVAGAALLADDCWERRPELAFPLELQRAECEFLTGALAAAEDRLTALSGRAANTLEQATVACLRLDLYTTLDQSGRAIGVGLAYLRHLGIHWSPRPTEEEARREYERIRSRLGSRTIEELVNLPVMSDPESLASLDVLTKLTAPALLTDMNLCVLVICRAVALSLERGHSDGSCFAYEWLGSVAGGRFDDYEAGARFARLGYELVEQRGLRRFQARTYLCFGSSMPFTRLRDGRDLLSRAFDAANQVGDLTYAAYACYMLTTNRLAAGHPLLEVQREAEHGLAFAQKMRFGLVVDITATQLALVRALRGSTRKFGCFDDEHFDEPGFERRVSSNPDLARAECWYWIRKAQARFFAGDYAAAVDASAKAQGLLWTSLSLLETADYCFYGSLSHAASCDSATAEARQRHVEALASLYAQLRVWAEHRPENFEQRAALICAEIARLDGRDLEAMRHYEHAIRSAGANGFIHDEALANEVAARFYAARGFGQIAALYLRNARHGYLSWGADGKVRQLDQRYPQLRKEEPSPDARGTIGATVEHLELATVLKVSQAVSGEIVLENLVETLLRTAIEHAGAERGLLILPRGGDLLIQAEATTGGNSVTVRVHETPVGAARLPESVVRYAARTQDSVILDDAWARNPFSTDEYILAQGARSALCLPLVKQGALVALLYLENNLAPNVFTPARIAVLKVLASEAAMALENSRLYRELQEREAKIRRLVDANIVGVSIWTFEGRILEANDAFLDIVGYAREDLASGRLRWTELTPPEWDAASERSLAQIRATGRADLFEKEYVRKDGSRVPVLVTSAAIDRSSNVAFVLDLTERKRTDAALQRAQTELAHISRVMTLGELTSSIAHEINQPIAAMVTSAGSALRWLGAPQPELDKARRSLERIAKDGRRASEILNRIRALVKRQPSRKEPLDINAAILEVIALTRDPVRTNDISLESRLAPGLPRVHGDRVQLEQVILNLIVNAVEAMAAIADHRRRLAIASLRDAAGGVRVEVRDSGTGLDPDRAEKLFEPFYTTKAQGLGVGLAISRSIIEDHGGKLWATANVPRGAVFQFSLPLGEAQA